MNKYLNYMRQDLLFAQDIKEDELRKGYRIEEAKQIRQEIRNARGKSNFSAQSGVAEAIRGLLKFIFGPSVKAES